MRRLSEGEGNQHYDSREARKTFPELTKSLKLGCVTIAFVVILDDRTQDERKQAGIIKPVLVCVWSPVAAVVGWAVSLFDRQPRDGGLGFTLALLYAGWKGKRRVTVVDREDEQRQRQGGGKYNSLQPKEGEKAGLKFQTASTTFLFGFFAKTKFWNSFSKYSF